MQLVDKNMDGICISTTIMEEKIRYQYLDSAKGFAILLMVMGHFLAANIPEWKNWLLETENRNVFFLWAFIYSFHMAFFFMISGYLSYKVDIDIKQACIKKTKRLLIPYLTTGIFLYFHASVFGYWFLFSLWELSLMCIFFSKISSCYKNNLIIDLVFIVLIFVFLNYVLNLRFLDNPICKQGKCMSYFFPYMGETVRKP